MLYSQYVHNDQYVSAEVRRAIAERHGPFIYRPIILDSTDGYAEMMEEQNIDPRQLVKIIANSYPSDYGCRLPGVDNWLCVNYGEKSIYVASTDLLDIEVTLDGFDKAIRSLSIPPIQRLLEAELDKKTSVVRDSIEAVNSRLLSYYQNIANDESYLVEQTLLLKAMIENQMTVDVGAEIEKIKGLTKVRSVAFELDQYLIVILRPIICDRRNLGAIKVTINLADEGLNLRMERVTARYHPEQDGYCHPHVSGGGNPCWGNLADTVVGMRREWQLSGLISLCIGFLEIWYPSGQPFVVSMEDWGPELSLTRLTKGEVEIGNRQADYNYEFDEHGGDNWEYDDECECSLCIEYRDNMEENEE